MIRMLTVAFHASGCYFGRRLLQCCHLKIFSVSLFMTAMYKWLAVKLANPANFL